MSCHFLCWSIWNIFCCLGSYDQPLDLQSFWIVKNQPGERKTHIIYHTHPTRVKCMESGIYFFFRGFNVCILLQWGGCFSVGCPWQSSFDFFQKHGYPTLDSWISRGSFFFGNQPSSMRFVITDIEVVFKPIPSMYDIIYLHLVEW